MNKKDVISFLENEVDKLKKSIENNRKKGLDDYFKINSDSESIDCINYVIEYLKKKG